MKTIKEWLEALPDGYRERALKNLDVQKAQCLKDGFENAIYAAFFWGESEEGHAFWNEVAHENLPQFPPPKSINGHLLAALKGVIGQSFFGESTGYYHVTRDAMYFAKEAIALAEGGES